MSSSVEVDFGDSKDDVSFQADLELVKEMLEIEDGLNGWEMEFVISVGEKVLEKGFSLSEGQRAKCNEILARMEDDDE